MLSLNNDVSLASVIVFMLIFGITDSDIIQGLHILWQLLVTLFLLMFFKITSNSIINRLSERLYIFLF